MLRDLAKNKDYTSFSLSAENFTGEKGKGGMATEGTGANSARDLGIGWKISPCVNIEAGETFTMADIKGSGSIKHIWLTYRSADVRNLILRMYWDGQESPAVEVPLGDFFASATADFRQVSSLAVCANVRKGLNCYWEMPYRTGFRITLENRTPDPATLFYQIDCEKRAVEPEELYFHAQFRRVNPLPYKEVYTILDNITGSGKYVGTYMLWGSNNNGWWGEGEIKFYLDGDTDFPTICGTGTEDYFCGAWCFVENNRYQEYCTPYCGFSQFERSDPQYPNLPDYGSQSRFHLYRWHITDPIYFKKDLRITIQALGWRDRHRRYLPLQDDISSVAYWYSDNLQDHYPVLPDRDYLEII